MMAFEDCPECKKSNFLLVHYEDPPHMPKERTCLDCGHTEAV